MTSNTSKQSMNNRPFISMNEEDDCDTQQIMHTFRHFHLGNPKAAEQLPKITDAFLPALLAEYRDTSQLRYDYPLYLSNNHSIDESSDALAKPIAQFLQECVLEFAPTAEIALILKDNLAWIERDIRNSSRSIEGPTAFKPLLSEAGKKLLQHLRLDEASQQRLQDDIEKLIAIVPENGLILSYGRFPALHLLMHLISNQSIPQMSLFKEEVEEYINELQVLLDVDDSKSDQASSAEALKSNISSNQFFNTESLSKVVKQVSHGSVSMSAERRKRIENALSVLIHFTEKDILIHIVHASNVLDDTFSMKRACFTTEHHDDPCSKATEIFDREAGELAEVFSASRIAKLEIANAYDENIHDPWFNNFSWETFSKRELILVPSVIVLEAANRLVDQSMVSFSHLLSSGQPVNIFVRVQAHNNPGAREDEDPFESYRTELGYLGISHRQAVVTQSSAARHSHLLNHFNTALNATRTSLHLINVGLREVGEDAGLNAWLVAGAALEGRAHPFFSIDPSAGDSSAERVDFEGNPQNDKDWPIQSFSYLDRKGEAQSMELSFTFADYALLIPRLNHHFGIVNNNSDCEELVPIADYLALSLDDIENLIPYIWAVDSNNELYKLVVSIALIHACRDRLNFWHSLQEMAGIRNRYIENAEVLFKADAEIEVAKQVAQAKAEFDAEIERVKTESAAEVMSRLTDMLLGMDLTAGAVRTAATATPLADVDVTTEVEEVIAEAEEEAEDLSEEPWIDAPLCTTCNDCTDINPIMFVYNESKQAYIADLSAGTYKQMVEAAEICPSKCIHPGNPWDDSETDLDELMERARAI